MHPYQKAIHLYNIFDSDRLLSPLHASGCSIRTRLAETRVQKYSNNLPLLRLKPDDPFTLLVQPTSPVQIQHVYPAKVIIIHQVIHEGAITPVKVVH